MFSNIDRPLIVQFSMAISTHFLKPSSESTDLRPGQCTRRAQSLSHAFVDVRRMKPPRGQWSPATVSSWKIGKSPEPWRHWYPTSHSPATYLTHKLTSFKAIEIDMGLCQFFDTIPASVDETVDKFLHLLIGPCPSRCYIAMENHHL